VLYSDPHMSNKTRQTILETLQSRGKCTVKELARAAGVSPVSVRHHLSNLQADGLIKIEEVRHGVGRPRHLFSLTDAAHELFPTRYYRLANRLLLEIKDTLPEGSVDELFSGMAADITEQFRGALAGLPISDKLPALARLLEEEGFQVAIEKEGGRVLIKELTCPYLHVGRKHPEVCLVDRSVIAGALGLPVERVAWLLEGDAHCTYAVQLDALSEEATQHE
jgi:DeoR family suf operon transcriptional repressor